MPTQNEQELQVWPSRCERINIKEQLVLRTSADENAFLQVLNGKVNAVHDGHARLLPARTVVALAREIRVELSPVDGQPVTVAYLCLRRMHTPLSFDLHRLCLTVSLVDSFFALKPRYCVLTDREYIFVVFGAIIYEWNNRQPEREAMLESLLREFFIKLARSYHAHNRPTGIHYLASARAYIQQNFQSPLTVEEIAEHSGISRSYLSQLFAAHMNRSVVEYIQSVRCDHAAYLLSTTRFSIIDIAVECGFNNRQHFARTFGRVYGMSPHDYRTANTTL